MMLRSHRQKLVIRKIHIIHGRTPQSFTSPMLNGKKYFPTAYTRSPGKKIQKKPSQENSGTTPALALIIVQHVAMLYSAQIQNLPAHADGPAFSKR